MNDIKVGIVMGSDSDLAVVSEAAKVLEEFGVEFEIKFYSAHRAPNLASEYAKSAALRGLKVIIAAASGAAHLPGVVAAHTPLPVIGIPVKGKALEGLDSLLSIAQMPPGVPVATVTVDGARNAGILAVQILATSDAQLQKKVIEFKDKLEQSGKEKTEKIDEIGYKKYLGEKSR